VGKELKKNANAPKTAKQRYRAYQSEAHSLHRSFCNLPKAHNAQSRSGLLNINLRYEDSIVANRTCLFFY